jgi:hypothetical protein
VSITELVGKKVFVRSVTNYYTGLLAEFAEGDDWLRLDDAAWIADTGRFHVALRDGQLNEVEPYPGSCYVAAGAVVDVCEWKHELPRTAQ